MAQLIPYDDRDGHIWLNGEIVAWRDAKVHVLTHGLHYGSSVFEGERCYAGRIFKSTEHSQRLIDSGRILGFEVPYSVAELDAAKAAMVARSGLPGLLCPPDRVARLRADGCLGAAVEDQRRDRGLGVGRLLQRPAPDAGDLRPAGTEHRAGARQGRRALHDLHDLQARRRGQGLRRRADAGLSRLPGRDHRRQPVPGHRTARSTPRRRTASSTASRGGR